MTRMMPAIRTNQLRPPRRMGGRISTMGSRVRRVVDLGVMTAEVFPPVVLAGGLALYFYMLACMGQEGEGTSS